MISAVAAAGTYLLLWTEQAGFVSLKHLDRSENYAVRVFGWRRLLIVGAVCLLALTLVTRYCSSQVSLTGKSHSVKSRLAEPKVQRVVKSRDGSQALPRAQRLSIVAISVRQPVVLESSPLLIFDVGAAISNRAPPRSSRLS